MCVMSSEPTISLVTSLSGGTAFISHTIESVLAQDYPNVEHIIVDCTTGATAGLQSKYSHLKIARPTDPGVAQSINAGFHAATGEIFGLLHAGDSLEPGALRAIAEVLAVNGCLVASGRSRLVDNDGRYFGVECASGPESARRLLEIWRSRWVTRAAIYWRREVWQTCGPLRVEAPPALLEYDLVCRFSRQYVFHRVERLLASIRLSAQLPVISGEQQLEDAIAVSRRYWGGPSRMQYWRLLASYVAFRANRQSRAARLMRAGRQQVRGRQYGMGSANLLIGAALAPEVVLDMAAPVVKHAAAGLAGLKSKLSRRQSRRHPETERWFGQTALHSDGWAGPTLDQELTVEARHTTIALTGTVSDGHLRRPLELEAFLDGSPLGRSRVGQAGSFAVTWNLRDVEPGSHRLRIKANTFAVPYEYSGNLDYRPLSYRVVQLELGHTAPRPR
jgi:hypothetical protein